MGSRACAALLLLALGGCVWMMDAVPTWDVTYEGTVRRADGTPVAGAQVAIWLDPPPEGRAPPPFGVMFTNASGEFRMRGDLRADVPPIDAFVRVFPPEGSGLAPLAFEGIANEAFSVTRDGRRVRYEAAFVLHPAAAPKLPAIGIQLKADGAAGRRNTSNCARRGAPSPDPSRSFLAERGEFDRASAGCALAPAAPPPGS